MDDKTRVRCNNCGSEFYEDCIEYYLETDDPESDCIGHCPVCWEKDVSAISIIDPEAIRSECARAAQREKYVNDDSMWNAAYNAGIDDAVVAILSVEPAKDDGKSGEYDMASADFEENTITLQVPIDMFKTLGFAPCKIKADLSPLIELGKRRRIEEAKE